LRLIAIATDFDATLATEGRVFPETLAALAQAQASGRTLILITGRELQSLQDVFSELDLFDIVVAENGALLYQPATNRERLLCKSTPNGLLTELRRRGVKPLSAGRCIVATTVPHETTVETTIRDLKLRWDIIMNRESVMVLPHGINKGTGFAAALADLGLSPESVMGIGDAENDHAFLRMCGLSVAVANAIPELKKEVQLVTKAERGAGVEEAIQHLLSTDR
jgi:hydroxymethylpyrimidine pyrophosphatase-like HAD family hydrolase